MSSRSPILFALLLLRIAVVPVVAQTDEQTQELLEKEKRYYERQMQQQEESAAQTQQQVQVQAEGPDEAEVAAFLAEADRLIRDANYDFKQTEHYRVQTDDPRLIPGAATALLESFRGFFQSFWEERAELRIFDKESRLFLFYSYFKYNQVLTGKPRFDQFQSAGHYRPYFDVVVIHTDSLGGAEALPDTLVHEAAHQLISRQLYGLDGEEEHWVAEGLASYFGFTARGSSGEFQDGAIGGKGIILLRGEKRPAGGQARERLNVLKRSLRAGPPPVHDLLAIEDAADYYAEGLLERYTLSWMLTHYLFHGEEGKLSDGFVRYLLADAAGDVGPEDLYREIGRSGDELSLGLRAYVGRLKARPKKN